MPVVRREEGKWGGEQVISWALETVHTSGQGHCVGEMEEGLWALKQRVFGKRILEAQGFASSRTRSPPSLPDS